MTTKKSNKLRASRIRKLIPRASRILARILPMWAARLLGGEIYNLAAIRKITRHTPAENLSYNGNSIKLAGVINLSEAIKNETQRLRTEGRVLQLDLGEPPVIIRGVPAKDNNNITDHSADTQTAQPNHKP